MKVGVDARLLSRPITGIGRYTLEMCRALSKLENITLFLYSPAPLHTGFLFGLESANIKTRNWNSGVFRQLWGECSLPSWANNDKVDVFWGPAHRLPRWLPAKMARVVTIHDLVWKYAGGTMRPLSRMLEYYQMPLAVRTSDAVIADSNATAKAVKEEFRIDYDKLTVVSPGVNFIVQSSSFASLQKIGIKRPYFLFVGTLEPRKNLIRLLTAYSHLSESFKNRAMLVIVGGDGWGGVNISDTVDKLGLKNHILLLGYVEEAHLEVLYANAQFLAMPSLYEGFGLPLVEAMVFGTPVLTSNNSSMPEVAGDAGLLVDALDVTSIEKGLRKLIGEDNFRVKLALNAKKNASRFNWNKSARKLVSVFEKVIALRNSRQS